MVWFKVDDSLSRNKYVTRIPRPRRLSAMGLWTLLGTWCAGELTDGFVPEHMVAEFGGTPQQVRDLVELAGLWEAAPGGYQFKNWAEWQPTRAEVEAKRAKTAERVQRWRERNAVGNGVTNGVSNAAPDPTRPDPIETTPDGVVLARKRGTRLAADWLPAPELRDKMAAECPGLDFRREHDKFVDFWLSKSGANATKLDWGRTWCNWMRTAYERRPTPRPQNAGPNWDELAKRAEARDAAREATAV